MSLNFFEMKFDLGTLDSGERSLPFGLLVVMWDGLPYCLVHKVINDTYYCMKCQDSVLGMEMFKVRNKKFHKEEPAELVREFDWVVLLIGKGHLGLNMLKSFFELKWIPFLQDLAKIMEFRSDRALHCAKLCTDNHEAWQVLKIFYNGALDELLIPYVRHKIKSGSTPSVDEFVRWYMHEQFLTYCQALLKAKESYSFTEW